MCMFLLRGYINTEAAVSFIFFCCTTGGCEAEDVAESADERENKSNFRSKPP